MEQRYYYDRVTRQHDLYHLHGLRHAYAQRRYHEIVKEKTQDDVWNCPITGGPKRSQLSIEQKRIDIIARTIVSHELGHSRVAIVKNYIG